MLNKYFFTNENFREALIFASKCVFAKINSSRKKHVYSIALSTVKTTHPNK